MFPGNRCLDCPARSSRSDGGCVSVASTWNCLFLAEVILAPSRDIVNIGAESPVFEVDG